MPDQPDLSVLDEVLLAVIQDLTEAHDLTDSDDETPYYLLPTSSTGWIAECIVTSAAALHNMLAVYRLAAASPRRQPSGPT